MKKDLELFSNAIYMMLVICGRSPTHFNPCVSPPVTLFVFILLVVYARERERERERDFVVFFNA